MKKKKGTPKPIKVTVQPAEGPLPDLGEIAENLLAILAEQLERNRRREAQSKEPRK